MLKGEIWWASLWPAVGSEPGKTRPVLIIQSDDFNRSKINTVICAIITKNTRLSNIPGNIFLPKADSYLPNSSVINFTQIVTLNKSDLRDKVSTLNNRYLNDINKVLKNVFNLF